MKKNTLFIISIILFGFSSCNDSEVLPRGNNEYVIATPLTANLISFKEEAVEITDPIEIVESGKIYAYKNYIFINDVYRGLHVLDNTNPESPQPIKFIKLEGNNDISIKDDRLYGQGGSLARFRIVGDYLYAVEWSSINVFDISDLDAPEVLDEVYTDWGIETIFSQGDLLFLGGNRGMFIYDISEPETPKFVSDFQHGRACDPVVVDGNYAYVTLRGGNACGTIESGLYVVDISNIENPELEVIYPMDGPYGLGIKDNMLFICDGASGLRVFDKSDAPNITALSHIDVMVTYDVIPMQEQLLMIGDGVLYQYEYLENDIKLISQLSL